MHLKKIHLVTGISIRIIDDIADWLVNRCKKLNRNFEHHFPQNGAIMRNFWDMRIYVEFQSYTDDINSIIHRCPTCRSTESL